MRKNGKERPRRQRADAPPASLFREALEETIRGTLQDSVIALGFACALEVLEEERTRVCGPRYRHVADRRAHRDGHAPGTLVMGGRRVRVKRPRARTTAGDEVPMPSWAAWSAEDPLDARTIEQLLIGVSTRRYRRSLEELPDDLASCGTSRSAVSRRFVRGTKKKLAEVLRRDLSDLDLAVLMLDGVHFAGEHVIVAAVGIDGDGTKHVLGLWEGATENKETCTALLEDLVARGLPTDRALLVVIDGGKALDRAVRAVFGKCALIQRCQEHKKRNVLEALPESKRGAVKRALQEAFKTTDPERAGRMLANLARTLDEQHPGAARSLREGLDDLLTLKRLGLGGTVLERTLSSTNVIENLIGRVRDLSGRVKRWKSGMMILRWSAAGVLEAEQGFRRVRGYRDMPRLVAALRAHDAAIDGEGQESVAA
jgi:transposase-like protein